MSHVPADAFYTPAAIAQEMVASVRKRDVQLVADFAAGDGSLLRAARARWRNASLLGVDIDPTAVTALEIDGIANAIRCDFLNVVETSSLVGLTALEGKVDVVLLNPPFSNRGGSYRLVKYADTTVRCSRAMSFVLTSTRYLAAGATVMALLPASALTSERDAQARALIGQLGDFQVARRFSKYIFRGCVAETALVAIRSFRKRRHALTQGPRAVESDVHAAWRLRLQRGTVQMHTVRVCESWMGLNSAPTGLLRLLHTSDIRNQAVTRPSRWIAPQARVVAGPAVIVPRVGQPSLGKIAVYCGGETVALSDCLYAIECSSARQAEIVFEGLVRKWDALRAAYHGTGAPYLTVAGLVEFLAANVPLAEAANSCSEAVA